MRKHPVTKNLLRAGITIGTILTIVGAAVLIALAFLIIKESSSVSGKVVSAAILLAVGSVISAQHLKYLCKKLLRNRNRQNANLYLTLAMLSLTFDFIFLFLIALLPIRPA